MKKTIMTLSMLAFAGCFTIFESDYPAVEMAAAGNADVKVQLSGFEAAVTTYARDRGDGEGGLHPARAQPTLRG